MSLHLEWLESRILLYRLELPFTWEELDRSLDQAIMMSRTVAPAEIGTVLDVRGVWHIPPGALQRGPSIVRKKPTNANYVVVIGANPMIRAFYALVSGLFPLLTQKVTFADDLESARRWLRDKLSIRHLPPTVASPGFKNESTQRLYMRIVSDPSLFQAWRAAVRPEMGDGEIQYEAEQFVRELPNGPVLNQIDWIALITELFLAADHAADP